MEISAKTLHFIEEHREDDTRTLALQSKKYPDVDMAAAVTQIAGRQVAARKLLHGIWFFRIVVSSSFVYGAMFFRDGSFVQGLFVGRGYFCRF